MNEILDPETVKKAIPIVFSLILAAWGGTARYLMSIKGDRRAFSIGAWFAQVVISGFVGIVTYLLCQSAGLNPLMSAALVAISGHEGARALALLTGIWRSKLGEK